MLGSSWSGGGKKSHRTGATRSLKERGGYFTGDGGGQQR